MLIDFQAALPFLILALAVLALGGNSLGLFVVLMGFYGSERHARIARGLAIAADAQGYAAAVRQLGASCEFRGRVARDCGKLSPTVPS